MTREDAREYARWIAGGRVAIGATTILAPRLALRPWLGGGAGRPAEKVLARSLGGRDIALGLGAILAMD
ncbi:MAG TPA: hypothetical protein VG476_03060, partial [Acidimicrobiales bacterium]|nr:hypothetical protein [Acidimicrobiales bacterium]